MMRMSFREEPASRDSHYGYEGSVIKRVLSARPSFCGDMRDYSVAAQDQFNTNSCTGNSIVKAREIQIAMKYGIKKHVDLSRLAVYYLARELMTPSEVGRDDGAYLSSAAEAFRRFGTCAESLWPFDVSKVNVSPTWSAMRHARFNAIEGWAKIRSFGDKRVARVIEVLKSGVPVPYGTACNQGWFDHKPGDVLRACKSKSDVLGYHATTLVGWLADVGLFVGENSWGDDWGDEHQNSFTGQTRRGFYLVEPEVIASDFSSDFVVMCDAKELAYV